MNVEMTTEELASVIGELSRCAGCAHGMSMGLDACSKGDAVTEHVATMTESLGNRLDNVVTRLFEVMPRSLS